MRHQNLSKRELEVGAHFADGKNEVEIAKDLSISRSTAHSHLQSIADKTGQDLEDSTSLIDWLKSWFGVE